MVLDGDAAIGPVPAQVPLPKLDGSDVVGLAVDHDHATRVVPPEASESDVPFIGIGDMDGLVKTAVGIAPIEEIITFRCPLITLPYLVASRSLAELDSVFTYHLAVPHERQPALRFFDHYLVGPDPLLLGFTTGTTGEHDDRHRDKE